MPDLQALLDQIDRFEPELATAPWFVSNANEDTDHLPFWQVMNHAYLNDPGTEDDVYCDVEMYVGSKEDAEFIALARTALPQLAKAVRAVLELHKPQWSGDIPPGGYVCAGCNIPVESEPCDTVQAITHALEPTND